MRGAHRGLGKSHGPGRIRHAYSGGQGKESQARMSSKQPRRRAKARSIKGEEHPHGNGQGGLQGNS
eukprot:11629347-Prorocentrum_lima.AAC.1